MKRLTILLLFLSTSTFAQSSFKKGYFITNDGTKKEVFIKAFTDALEEKIYYKESPKALEIVEVYSSDLKELNTNNTHFVRRICPVEFLEPKMIAKDGNNETIFAVDDKNILLKLEFESEIIRLYSYFEVTTENTYFFLEVDNNLELLEYKKITKNGKLQKVNKFRNYLFKNLKLEKNSYTNINLGKLGYNKNDLVNYLEAYSMQNNTSYKIFKSNGRYFKDAFNITPIIGYSTIKTKVKSRGDYDIFNSDFNSNLFNFGLELEYFVNTVYKTSAFVVGFTSFSRSNSTYDFNFQSSSPNTEISQEFSLTTISIKYRHYFRLANSHYLFLDGGMGFQNSSGFVNYYFVPSDTFFAELSYTNENGNLNTIFNLGIGYNLYNLQVGIEFIPSINQDLKNSNRFSGDSWYYERNLLNFVLKYSVF